MFKKINILLILILLLSVTPIETLEAEYKKLCVYDQAYCKRLKADDEFREPEPSLVSALEGYRQDMLEAAKLSGVDPRAIAGAILTENTLNVSLKDQAQSFLVSVGLAKDGKFLGKSFSYGFGQINCNRALEVEKRAAQIHSRPERSQYDVCRSLLDPKETIKYIGVIIKDAIDTYKENGIDISGDIGVQTTLYNLGQVKQRAMTAKANNALPRVNFFGFFTNMHIDQLGKITSVKTATRKSEFKDDNDYDLVDGVNSSLDLKSNPPFCEEKVDGETRKASDVRAVNIRSEVGPFEILNRYLDCDSKPWVLIKDSKNNEGWIKESDLEKKTTKFAVQDTRKCEYQEPACVESIKDKNKYNINSIDKQFGGVVFTTNGGGKSSKRGLAKYSPDCVLDDQRQGGFGFSSQSSAPLLYSSSKLTSKEIQQLRQQLNDYLKRNAENTQVFNTALSNFYSLYICESNCFGSYSEINDFLKGDNQSKTKSLPAITSTDYKVKSDRLAALTKSCGQVRGDGNSWGSSSISYYLSSNLYYLVYDLKRQNADFVNKLTEACDQFIASSDDEKKSFNWGEKIRNIKTALNINDAEIKNKNEPSSCGVNLGQTLNNLSSFLTTKCVDKIYIPDQTMYSVLNNIYPGKVGFMSSQKSDRYTVTFRESCQGLNKVIKESPTSGAVKSAN